MVTNLVHLQPLIRVSYKQIRDQILGFIANILPNGVTEVPIASFDGSEDIAFISSSEKWSVSAENKEEDNAETPAINLIPVALLAEDLGGWCYVRLEGIGLPMYSLDPQIVVINSSLDELAEAIPKSETLSRESLLFDSFSRFSG